MKAIETCYNGYRFRSRLEARWAVFLNTLGITYHYEPEGFDLGNAGWYLPDFWLPDHNCWLEIKPDRFSGDELAKAMALTKHTGKMLFFFYQCRPFETKYHWKEYHCRVHRLYSSSCEKCQNGSPDMTLLNGGHYVSPCGDFDGIMEFGVCESCDQIVIGHFGGHSIFCPKEYDYKGACPGRGDDHHPRLIEAYSAALSARFEHGETPLCIS